jgi:HSP20 family protein
VPGCKAEDIDISVYGNTLTISGEKKETEEEKRKDYYHVESTYGSFRRDLTLPTEVDESKIDAVCKNGVLTITLPKAEKSKAVKVKVKG